MNPLTGYVPRLDNSDIVLHTFHIDIVEETLRPSLTYRNTTTAYVVALGTVLSEKNYKIFILANSSRKLASLEIFSF